MLKLNQIVIKVFFFGFYIFYIYYIMETINQKKYLIIRILGNDLESLHGCNQTYTNLEFTLENEDNFYETDKMFILNRIFDTEKKSRIICLLNKYNVKYEDIPFDIEEFNELPKINDIPYSEIKSMDKYTLIKTLVNHNIYLVNNNESRNYGIIYGKKNNYLWTFVLDSNSYFTYKSYNEIISNIDNDSDYIVIPQKRLKDGNLDNNMVCDESLIDSLPEQEPQIAFKNTSKYIFNPYIPYGLSPKAEFLTAINVPGIWQNWMKHYRSKMKLYGLNLQARKFTNVKYQKLSKIIRLSPHNNNNNRTNNWLLRWYGIFLLAKNIHENM